MPADRTNKPTKAKATPKPVKAPKSASSKASTSAAADEDDDKPSTSSKKDDKKPWSRRVQQPPQPLPKSLLSQKRKADAPAPVETQEEADAPILTGLDPSAYHSSSSEGEDSSDDDESDGEPLDEGIDVGKLPTIAKDDATVKRKLEKAKKSKVRLGLQDCVGEEKVRADSRNPFVLRRTRHPESSISVESPTVSTRSR